MLRKEKFKRIEKQMNKQTFLITQVELNERNVLMSVSYRKSFQILGLDR